MRGNGGLRNLFRVILRAVPLSREHAMPVYSMTGYASAQHSTASSPAESETKSQPAARLGLEIRSVNSRFLDLSFRLAEELRPLEPALREQIVGKLKRGKVEVRAFVESANPGGVTDPSPRLLQRLNAAQDAVRAWLPQATPLAVADVLRLAAAEQGSARDWTEIALPLAEKPSKNCWTHASGKAPGWPAPCWNAWPSCAAWQPRLAPWCRSWWNSSASAFGPLERSHGPDRWRHPARGRPRPRPE